MTLRIKLLSEKDLDRWDAYAKKMNASIYHQSRWRSVIKDVFKHEDYYLYAEDENEIIRGILPLININSRLFGNYLVSMPYFNYGGVISDAEQAQDLLLSEAEKIRVRLGASHIELRELVERKSFENVRDDKVTMLLELPDDSDDLWSAIGAKRRAQVKRPIREGVEFKFGGKELLDEFYRVFSTNMRDLGTPVYNKLFFKTIMNYFPDESCIVVVSLAGEPVGAGFLISWDGVLEIPWASTLRKVNRIGVNMYMYWNILKYAIENGYKVFDFGRSSKDAGTLRFKKQWGSKQKQLYWHYLMDKNSIMPGLNPSNPKYKTAIEIWKRLPVPVANYLGPFIVKGLP